MSQKFRELFNSLNKIEGHGFAKLISMTGNLLNKKGRDGSPLPDNFSDLKKITLSQVWVGRDYNKGVINKIKKAGFDPKEMWTPEPSRISEADPDCHNGIIRQGLKDNLQKYVRFIFDKNTTSKSIFINNNIEVKVTVSDQENFFKSPPSKAGVVVKQSLSGVKDNEEILVREYKFESVLYFKFGEIEYFKDQELITMLEAMNFFNE